MERKVIPHLKNCYLFQGIDEKDLLELAKYFRSVKFPRDSVICREGDLGNTVYVITEGEVSVQKDFSRLIDENTLFARHILSVITERLRMSDDTATQDILSAYRALVFSLAKLAESRDPETGAHLSRVRDYSVLLVDLLSAHPRYKEQISSSFMESIFFVSPLHDIGKVAIPDEILLKPGKLTVNVATMLSTMQVGPVQSTASMILVLAPFLTTTS